MTLTLRWKTISHVQIWCARVQQKGQAFRSNIKPFIKKYSSSLSAHGSWSNLCFMSWQKEGAAGKVLPELWRLLHRPRLSNSLIKKQNKTQQCTCREKTGRRQHFPHSCSGCGAAPGQHHRLQPGGHCRQESQAAHRCNPTWVMIR